MNTIRRTGWPAQHFVCLPLDVARAAVVIRQQFSEAEIKELVRLLHWRCPDCHPPVEEEDR